MKNILLLTTTSLLFSISVTAQSVIIKPTGTGFMGVGTSSPQYKLHVKNGNAAIENDLPYVYLKTLGVVGSGSAGILFTNSQNQGKGVIRYLHNTDLFQIVNGSSPTDGITLIKNPSASFINMVGMGTSSPTSKLHIKTNSTGSLSQLLVEESTVLDYSRISFSNSNSTDIWTLAGRADDDVQNLRFNIYNSQFGNVASFYGNGNTELAGFTKLGSSAPKVKMVKLTGTTDDASYTYIDHGNNFNKILAASVFIYANDYYKFPPGNSSISYNMEIFTGSVNLTSVPALLRGKPYQVLLTVEE
jgi:hypothetical protein